MLTADEVIRSLHGSLQLFRREPEGLHAFDTSVEGCWRSFAAILLASPAFVVSLADARVYAGLFQPGTGLFDDPGLVIRTLLVFLSGWIAFPLLMIGFVRLMRLEQRYVGYLVAYNWSAAIAAGLFAFPRFLHVIGFATGTLAAFHTLVIAIVVLHYRWFLARTALGISAGLAAAVVGLDVGVAIAVRVAIAALVG